MIGALVAFAIATYFLTDSFIRTLVETVICAILLQIGYFLGVLYLSWREAKARRTSAANGQTASGVRGEDPSVGLPTSNMNRSEPFNR
jgi:exopolysaccharide production repressor protein